MEEFIGYVHRRKILDIYVSAIVYYGAWRCMIHVINSGYDLSKNEDLTAYLCNNRELTEEDIRDRERFIVGLGGQISLRKKYINRI